MLSWSKGNVIANIFRMKESEKGQELITKLKIYSDYSYVPDNSKLSKSTSRKDSNLVINNENMFILPPNIDDTQYSMRFSPTKEKDQNMRMVIIGPSGSGKTTFAKNLILDYKKQYPKKSVYLFSRHNEDKSIDDAKPTRVIITEQDIVDSIKSRTPVLTNKHLTNSLVIFDDTYSSESKLLNKFWDSLATDLYQNGRKLGIDLIFIMHNTDYSRTRFLMSESTAFVLFLKSGANAMYRRILDSYLGIKDKTVQQKLFDLPSRYVVFSNSAPMFVMTENQVFSQDSFVNIL